MQLTALHREMYAAVFAHPAPARLHRGSVESMLASVADVSVGLHGSLTFTRNGQSLCLQAALGGNLKDGAELMAIRHFLQRAGAYSMGAVAEGNHLTVVIDDRAARIYEVRLRGSTPDALVSYDPHGFAGHLAYAPGGDVRRPRQPECRSFYEAVAKTLRGAERVSIVFGSAPGARGAVNELIAELRLRHPELARRVAGVTTVEGETPSTVALLLGVQNLYRRLHD